MSVAEASGGGRIAAILRASRPLRFLIVGGLNTLACYLVFAALVWEGVDFKLANFASLIFGICLNFTLQGRFVFDDRDPRRFFRFALFWFAIYCAQTGVIWLLVRVGLSPQLAGLIVLPGTAVVSYFVQKSLVFRSGGGKA